VVAEVRDMGSEGVAIDSDAAAHLGVGLGTEIILLPLD